MDGVIQYLTTAVARTGAQLLVVFGVVFALAVVLWFVSQGIRGMVSSRIGMAYYYFAAVVASGVGTAEETRAFLLGGLSQNRVGTYNLRDLKTKDGVMIYLFLPPHYLAQYGL